MCRTWFKLGGNSISVIRLSSMAKKHATWPQDTQSDVEDAFEVDFPQHLVTGNTVSSSKKQSALQSPETSEAYLSTMQHNTIFKRGQKASKGVAFKK